MCCITIDADVLLLNIFGSPECRADMKLNGISLDVAEKCAVVLSNNLPAYVFCDLSHKRISRLVKEDNGFVIRDGRICYRGGRIDRCRCNAIYISEIACKICDVVDKFFQCGMYEKEVKKQMRVYA